MNKRCIFCQSISEVSEEDIDCPKCGNVNKLTPFLSMPSSFMRGSFEPFRSTVDGSIISSSRSMEEHNKRNGVVCMADGYSNESILSGLPQKQAVKMDKNELMHDIAEAAIHVRDGYRPEVQSEQ